MSENQESPHLQSAENPYLGSAPGPLKKQMLRQIGTPEEKQWLDELEAAERRSDNPEAVARVEDYRRKVYDDTPREIDPERKLKDSVLRMKNLMLKGFAEPEKVTGDHIIASKRLLFQAYREVIWKKSKAEPQIEKGDQLSRVLTAASHWLLGIEQPEGKGFDPRKSLYLCGPTGNGKSSIAKAMHFASQRLAHDFGVGFPIGIRSMKRVVTDIHADKTLAPIKDLSEGHLVLDEIRTEQIELKHFGNEIPIVADVLYNRYDSWDFDALQTILTTNLKPGELTEALGDGRLTDRINDQYQVVLFTGAPFRDTEMAIWQ